MRLKTNDLDAAGQAAAWNRLIPVGTVVRYTKDGRPGGSGLTRSRALVPAGTIRAVVWVDDWPEPVPVVGLEVLRPDTVDPCQVCGHARAGHGIRYKALRGDHEWCDPQWRPTAATPGQHAERLPPCDCGPGEHCRVCEPDAAPATDPYAPQPDRAGPFTRIFNAPKRTR